MKIGMRGRVSSTVRPRDPVLPPHHEHDHGRRDDGLHELGQVAAEVRLEGVESAAGGDGELRRSCGSTSQPGPSAPDRVDQSAARSCASHARGRAGARPSRAATAARRARRTTASSAPRVGGRASGSGIPSIAPVIARVSSHANATITAVCATPIDRDQRRRSRARRSRSAAAAGRRVGCARARGAAVGAHSSRLNARPTPAAFSMRVRVTRLRKIQYVQPW